MRKYLVAGLLVWLPLAVTVWVLNSVLGLINGVFDVLLSGLQWILPDAADPVVAALRRVPGLGVIVMGVGLLLSGVLATNIAGQWLLRNTNRLLSHIPIVKSIYNSVKQVSDTLFSSSGNAFREAVLVQYPRAGSWTIAFVTGQPSGETAAHLANHVSVYVPTTPNPTSGFFLMVPRAEVVTLAMSVDEALKYVISMGVVAPPTRAPTVLVPSRASPVAPTVESPRAPKPESTLAMTPESPLATKPESPLATTLGSPLAPSAASPPASPLPTPPSLQRDPA